MTTGLNLLAQCSSLGRHLFHFLIKILGTATGPVAGVTAELFMRGGVTVGSVPELGATAGHLAKPWICCRVCARSCRGCSTVSVSSSLDMAHCSHVCILGITRATADLPPLFYQFLRILQLLGDEGPKAWGCPPLQAAAQTVPHPLPCRAFSPWGRSLSDIPE